VSPTAHEPRSPSGTANGMSPAPLPIKSNRCHDRNSENPFLSSSYLSVSPIAHKIIARDLAECFDDDDYADAEDDGSLSELDHETIEAPLGAPLISRPSGVAYGTLRPTIAAGVPGTPALNPRDLAESR